MTALPPPKRRTGWIMFDLIVIGLSALFLTNAANVAQALGWTIAGSVAAALMLVELAQPRM